MRHVGGVQGAWWSVVVGVQIVCVAFARAPKCSPSHRIYLTNGAPVEVLVSCHEHISERILKVRMLFPQINAELGVGFWRVPPDSSG